MVHHYENFIVEMLGLSCRPTKTWILKACEASFQKVCKDTCGSFAQRFAEVARFCHKRKLAVKTGTRQHFAMRRVLKILNEQEPQGLGDKFCAFAKKRILEKRISQATTPSPKRRKKAAASSPLASCAAK